MMAKVLAVVACLALAAPALAWQPPSVEYSADSLMETAGEAVKGRVHRAHGRERREISQGGEKVIMIMREDKKVAWTVMPEERMYMEMKLDQARGKDDLSAYKIEQTTVGQEAVNGVNTIKSKVVMTDSKGGKMGGFWWTTKEGIVVKMDVLAIEKGSKDRIKMDLTNLKIGKQDPKLFEVPAGYTKMSMPGFGQ